MTDWAARWDTCQEIARSAFRKIREAFPRLSMEITDPVVGEGPAIQVSIPKQVGLDFDVYLNFQNVDELHVCIGNSFWVRWFPCDISGKTEEYIEAVCGILSGNWRIIEKIRDGRAVGAYLEKPVNGRWELVCTSNILHIPWPWQKKSTRVLQNRR